MEVRLGFEHLIAEPAEQSVITIGERIGQRLLDGVGGVALGAVDVRDGMAGNAGDASVGSRIVFVVEVGIIEFAGEERHQIVTTGAPARGPGDAVLIDNLARLTNTKAIRRIVEGAKM